MSNIKAFQTGRLYCHKGQRIAYAVLSTGNIGLMDIDRGIDNIYPRSRPDLPLRDSTVLAIYDASKTTPWNDAEYQEFCELRPALKAAAESVEAL